MKDARTDAHADAAVRVGGREPEPVAAQADAPPAETPLAEYPKMLYIGPYRQQVTVCTPDEEARWMQAHDEQMQPSSGATKASASVPGVQVHGAPVNDPESDAADEPDPDADEPHRKASKKR